MKSTAKHYQVERFKIEIWENHMKYQGRFFSQITPYLYQSSLAKLVGRVRIKKKSERQKFIPNQQSINHSTFKATDDINQITSKAIDRKER